MSSSLRQSNNSNAADRRTSLVPSSRLLAAADLSHYSTRANQSPAVIHAHNLTCSVQFVLAYSTALLGNYNTKRVFPTTKMDTTVFEDFCTAYDEAHKEIEKYLETYGQLMGNLITSLEVYLQCPTGRITYISRQGDSTTLREAMFLEGGAWHLKIGICMCRENGGRRLAASPSGLYYPSQTVFMTLSIRGTAESFIAKLDQYDEEFSINKVTEKSNREDFYKFIAEKIKSHYKKMLRYIVEHGEVPQILSQI